MPHLLQGSYEQVQFDSAFEAAQRGEEVPVPDLRGKDGQEAVLDEAFV